MPYLPAERDVGGTARDGVLSWPGLSSGFASLPAHDDETVTGAGQVGVAFSAHREVTYATGGRIRSATYPGGSVICSGTEPIVWSGVREYTEALELYPDPELVGWYIGAASGSSWPVERSVVGRADPVVVGIASIFRRAHTANAYLSDVAASTLAHHLVRHVLVEYAGAAWVNSKGHGAENASRHTGLSRGDLATIYDVVEEKPGARICLDTLAASVNLSPFHFARAFKASVGMAPYEFVTSRRMDRARLLLQTTNAPVERIAREVSFGNLSHFRRVFRSHVGETPAAYRAGLR
ncbi:MAG: helix-turn-helix transcriptional regulator [Geodermatophilaceae bacterium]|nr:helix-turn-helix transcriptional regulator [Geodermatophilaceae bacterium]